MADPEKAFFPAKPTPLRAAASNPEAKFWRSFKSSELSRGHVHGVTHLAFSPASPHDLAASVSASVLLFDAQLHPKPFSPISHFSDLSSSPSFRCDGSLLAASDLSGAVLLFDPSRSRPPLRRLSSHSRPVRLVRFPLLSDKSHLFSAGDDALFNYWDAAAASPVLSVPSAHKDYIRAGAPSPVNPDLFATGSYDHNIKLWDVRVGANAVSGFNHGAPVESVLFLPSGGLIATAGGNSVKIWDAIGGFRLLHSMESHNKTVTCICLGNIPDRSRDGSGSVETRILSVSIDGYLKVFDYASFKVTHSMRYPSMLLSVASSPTGFARVVGTSNGVIYAGKKKKKEKEEKEEKEEEDELAMDMVKKPLGPSNFRYFHRGQSVKPREGDYLIKRAARMRLAEHDKLLKKFRHRDALVSAMNKRNPYGIIAVMEELVARKKLMRCIGNLDESELGMLLAFLHKYATMPTHARFLMGLAKKVLEIRFEDVHKSNELKVHVRNLKRMVAEEIKIQISLQELKGMLLPLIRMVAR